MAKNEDKAAAETPPKSKKKLIIMLVGLVVLLGGAGGGGYAMFAPKSGAAAAEPPPTPGAVVPLDAITINLADGHYLKLKMSLQATADAGEEIDGSKALDLAIDEFSNRPMAELFSNDERKRAKEELVKKIEKAYEKDVFDIYFTTFVIQ
jgi:flagellar FliL protein